MKYIKMLFMGAVLILGMSHLLTAQKYDFKVYSVNDGLPQGQVHDIEQTNDGFIWMATNGGGLSRFDGRNFKTYTTKNGLKNNAVQSLYEDTGGTLWVSTYEGGVMKFQKDSLVNPFPADSLSHYDVWHIDQMKNGQLWFGTNEGGIFILEDGEISRLTTGDGLISNTVWSFNEMENDEIWIATQEGLSVFREGKFTNFTAEDGLSGSKIYQIAEDQQGKKWLATPNGITVWDGSEFKIIDEINGISLGYIFDVKVASDGKIWIGTENKGIFVYDGEQYTHFTRKNGLSSNYIYTFFEDNNNDMWIGTDENGASFYRRNGFLFYDENFGLKTDEVLSVNKFSDGTLWLGTTEGINSYDGEEVRYYPLPGEYENGYVWEVEELPNGHPLFLMPDQTLMEFDGKQFHNFTQEHGLQPWFTFDVMVDSRQTIWIATDEGLFRLKDNSLKQFTKENGMVGNVVQQAYEGVNGKLYIATYTGLSIFDGSEFTNVTLDDGLANSMINYITQDDRSNVWLGTAGGISLLKPVKGSDEFDITNFAKEDGLHLINTHFLWFDSLGYLWQGTNGGLNRLNVPAYRETGNMNTVHYALSEEGMGTEFNFKAVTVDTVGNAWFGSMKGALKLDISKLKNNTVDTPTKIHITDIERNSKKINWDEYSDTLDYHNGRLNFPKVTFPPGEHTYVFTFSGLNFRQPDNIEYRYRMKGFEEDWKISSSSNTATYTNLEPGDYTFMVQSIPGSHRIESDIASYQFSIAFPFWRTYWFYGLVFVSMVGAIYGYIQIRLSMLEKNQLKKRVEERTFELQKALEEKEVLIKEIHHRVKNNLAVISGLLDLQMGYSDNEFVSETLLESQRRIRSISMIHEKLYQNERLSDINFKKYIRELLEIISYSFSHLEKDIEMESRVDDINLNIDQGIPCGLILNEMVSNCFEHAFEGRDSGRIEVGFSTVDGTNNIEFYVSDNGKGLPDDIADQSDSSLGLTLIETLVEQLGGELNIESSSDGTTLTIHFEMEEDQRDIPI